MPVTLKTFAKVSLAVSCLTAAYVAGATGLPANVNKLDQAHDLLSKANAILGSIQSRQGYGAIEAAKAKLSAAQQDIQTAKQQMGG
jgi:hypothetical protein